MTDHQYDLSISSDQGAPDADRQRILAARAATLARAPDTAPAGERLTLVVLAVGPERFGVAIGAVLEILPGVPITPIPGAPAVWLGLVNRRGMLLPVLDLARCLGLAQYKSNAGAAPGRLVVVSAGTFDAGFLVDDVLNVSEALLASLSAPLVESATAGQRVITGITPDLVTVLDMRVLLADPRLVVQHDWQPVDS